jgi:hypothetical protein
MLRHRPDLAGRVVRARGDGRFFSLPALGDSRAVRTRGGKDCFSRIDVCHAYHRPEIPRKVFVFVETPGKTPHIFRSLS